MLQHKCISIYTYRTHGGEQTYFNNSVIKQNQLLTEPVYSSLEKATLK